MQIERKNVSKCKYYFDSFVAFATQKVKAMQYCMIPKAHGDWKVNQFAARVYPKEERLSNCIQLQQKNMVAPSQNCFLQFGLLSLMGNL